MNSLRRSCCALLLSFGLSMSMAACAATSPEPPIESLSAFPQSTLTIVTADARQQVLNIWLADTDAHREQGLMFIRQLPERSGMLFVFDEPQQVAMWMKNTLIPLDMLFIDSNGRVDSIIANATPLSLKILQSKSYVLGVLELAGGAAKALNIQVGAIVRYPAFASMGGSR